MRVAYNVKGVVFGKKVTVDNSDLTALEMYNALNINRKAAVRDGNVPQARAIANQMSRLANAF